MTLGGEWRDFDEDDDFLGDLGPYQIHCEECGYLITDSERSITNRGDYVALCKSGYCTEYRCARCHKVWGGAGPITCPTCGSFPSRWDRFCIRFDDWTDNIGKKIKRLTRRSK